MTTEALTACDPEVILPHDKPNLVTLRLQVVDQPPTGPQRSGRYIHIGVTLRDAMKLALLLQKVGTDKGVLAVGDPTVTVVPPKNERN